MSAFTPSAEIAFVQFDRAPKNLIGSQGQMIVDNRADFTVEQCCRIGMDSQNIGRSMTIREGEMAVVPKSVSHRPRSENGCSVVLIELPDPSEAV